MTGIGGLEATLTAADQSARRDALRGLILNPLVTAAGDPELFVQVVAHREWLVNWFAERTGWKLLVRPNEGFARLGKIPGRRDATRGARLRGGRPPFDIRRYTLLCQTLAILAESPGQITLRRLAELVEDSAEGEEGLPPLNPERIAERRAFVDALRWLTSRGILTLRDGDGDRFAGNREADALYDVDERIIAQLIASPLPPSLAGDLDDLMAEAWPDTEEGRKRAARHSVFRRLLDDPVVLHEDLNEAERAWLDHSLGYLRRTLADDVGLLLERRREGIAAVDPEGSLTDIRFPDGGSTVKHAALLLAEHLADRARADGGPLGVGEATEIMAGLVDDYGERCSWSRVHVEDPARLAREALGLLSSLRLAASTPRGFLPLPPVARFAPSRRLDGVTEPRFR